MRSDELNGNQLQRFAAGPAYRTDPAAGSYNRIREFVQRLERFWKQYPANQAEHNEPQPGLNQLVYHHDDICVLGLPAQIPAILQRAFEMRYFTGAEYGYTGIFLQNFLAERTVQAASAERVVRSNTNAPSALRRPHEPALLLK